MLATDFDRGFDVDPLNQFPQRLPQGRGLLRSQSLSQPRDVCHHPIDFGLKIDGHRRRDNCGQLGRGAGTLRLKLLNLGDGLGKYAFGQHQ